MSGRAPTRTLIVAGQRELAIGLADGLAAHEHIVALAADPADLESVRAELEAGGAELESLPAGQGEGSRGAKPIVDAIGLGRKVADELVMVRQAVDAIDLLLVVPRFDAVVPTLLDQRPDALQSALDDGAWPLVGALHAVERVFGALPRYAVAVSRDDLQRFSSDGAYRSVATAVLETFTRYMATHLRPRGVLVNALRLPATFENGQTGAVADVVAAIATGLLDAMSGQVLTVDRGQGLRRGIGVTEVR